MSKGPIVIDADWGDEVYECKICRDNEDVLCKFCGCKECGGKEDPETMLVCECCEFFFHMKCMDPPLETIPDDDWYCSNRVCQRVKRETETMCMVSMVTHVIGNITFDPISEADLAEMEPKIEPKIEENENNSEENSEESKMEVTETNGSAKTENNSDAENIDDTAETENSSEAGNENNSSTNENNPETVTENGLGEDDEENDETNSNSNEQESKEE